MGHVASQGESTPHCAASDLDLTRLDAGSEAVRKAACEREVFNLGGRVDAAAT